MDAKVQGGKIDDESLRLRGFHDNKHVAVEPWRGKGRQFGCSLLPKGENLLLPSFAPDGRKGLSRKRNGFLGQGRR